MWQPMQQGGGFGFPMNFAQTTIQPQSIYPRALTQQTINQQRAMLGQQYNPLTLAKQFDRPGVSRGPQTAAKMAPMMARGYAEQAAVGPNQMFRDAAENAQSMLAGQVAREGEGRAWGQLGAQQQNLGWQQQMGGVNWLMRLLGMYGGLG